jgi:hypothetical protein
MDFGFSSGKYLGKEDLINVLPIEDFDQTTFISADSYDEELLLKKINSYDKLGQQLLQRCAAHICVIGSGNRNFGSIRFDDKIYNLIDVFKTYNIQYQNLQNQLLKPDDLTPRRLCRVYRFHTQACIMRTKRASYLWLKYSDHDKSKASICFPGAEHLVDNLEDFEYLMRVYTVLDTQLGTGFCTRLQRVGVARGILKSLSF